MNYHTALDISPEPFSQAGFDLMNYNKSLNPNKHFRAFLNVSKHIRPEVVELLSRYNLIIRFIELFYTPANRASLIHIDGEPSAYMIPNNMAKINYIGGGEGSQMHWYQPIVHKQHKPTEGNKFISFQPDEVTLVGSGNLTGYNIAQTGIPHNITTANNSRYCVSMTLSIKDETPKMIPYEMMVALLAPHQLLH